MSDHEFEKQVHQKLEELKLRPSDSVWMEVERNLRNNNRRRRFMWLWMAALTVSLTTSGVVLFRRYTNDKTTEIAVTKPALTTGATTTASTNTFNKGNTNNHNNTSTPTAIAGDAPIANDNTPAAAATSINHDDHSSSSNQPQVVATPVAPKATVNNHAVLNKQQPALATTPNNTIASNETIGITNKKPVKQQRNVQPNVHHRAEPFTGLPNTAYSHKKPRANNSTIQPVAIANSVEPEQPQEVIVVKPTTTEAQPQQHELTTAMPVIVNEPAAIVTEKAATGPFAGKQVITLQPDSLSNNNNTAAVNIPRRKPSLWHWGVITDAGYSRITESKLFQLKGLLGNEKYLAEDLARSSSVSPGTASNSFLNISTGTSPVKDAAPIQADFSFSAGVFVQRIVSPRLKLSLGVEYSYMSVNTQIGQKVKQPILVNQGTSNATLVDEYYKYMGYSDQANLSQNYQTAYYSQKYRYRFQYVEMPLMINWQINKGRRMPPIQFEGGLSVARLIKVDALHYEGIKGVYYKDNDLFNKTQFNFITGLSVGLLQKSKHPIWIGPNLRYSLNGLVKKQVSTGQYLWSTGISIKVLLGKL